jgi:DNA-binding transcriptional LysR family regulator
LREKVVTGHITVSRERTIKESGVMDRLHTIKAFMNVLELRSYTGAARKLGLSRSHLSKQITSLEDNLGVRLLNRTTKHVSPTEIGEAYYEICARAVGELESAEADLGALRRQARGRLKILAPKSLAVLELVDASRSFASAYPDLEVAIFIEDESLDIVEHGFDLALRFGEQPDSALVARKIASFRLIPCATPRYLNKHGVPRKPADLSQHNCLRHLGMTKDSAWRFADKGDEVAVPVHGRISSNSTVFLRECVLHGEGIGLMPSYSVRKDIKARRLRPLLTKYTTASLPLYVVHPSHRHLATKVRICVDFLVDWFDRRADA